MPKQAEGGWEPPGNLEGNDPVGPQVILNQPGNNPAQGEHGAAWFKNEYGDAQNPSFWGVYQPGQLGYNSNWGPGQYQGNTMIPTFFDSQGYPFATPPGGWGDPSTSKVSRHTPALHPYFAGRGQAKVCRYCKGRGMIPHYWQGLGGVPSPLGQQPPSPRMVSPMARPTNPNGIYPIGAGGTPIGGGTGIYPLGGPPPPSIGPAPLPPQAGTGGVPAPMSPPTLRQPMALPPRPNIGRPMFWKGRGFTAPASMQPTQAANYISAGQTATSPNTDKEIAAISPEESIFNPKQLSALSINPSKKHKLLPSQVKAIFAAKRAQA